MHPAFHKSLVSLALFFLPLAAIAQQSESCPAKQHPTFEISVTPGLSNEPLSGRLIIMMSNQPGPAGKLAPSFGPEAHSVWVAAKEVHNLTSQQPVHLDPDELVYPDAFCKAPGGNYKIRAVLDVDHNFAYSDDASDGDLLGIIADQKFDPAADQTIAVTLVERKTSPPLQLPPRSELFDFESPLLSRFWGRSIHIRGAVVLPPGYSSGKDRYPTVYLNHGFSGDLNSMLQRTAPNLNRLMDDKKIPEMIWVLLVQASPTGTHEFAESVNNGPWGQALTTELIPYLEKQYRMDAKPSGRLLTGHSSGGWASLWIQVSHPDFFGGTWPTSPDTSDFRTFAAQVDITKRPPPNFYRTDDGSLRMFIRMGGKDVQSMQDLAQQERVLGEYGGQLASFDWVFGPRGKDGRPMPLFDRDTGAVDPLVAAYWEQHYDIANILRKNWKTIGPSLNGKIHLTVGTADTFHLDEPARLLQQTIQNLGGKASFTYLEGRSHFDLYQGGLLEQIAEEMYAVARPNGNSKLIRRGSPGRVN
jgi:S-formylglutathione hydrolase FrmB